LRRG
jgi:hypothetical protein